MFESQQEKELWLVNYASEQDTENVLLRFQIERIIHYKKKGIDNYEKLIIQEIKELKRNPFIDLYDKKRRRSFLFVAAGSQDKK